LVSRLYSEVGRLGMGFSEQVIDGLLQVQFPIGFIEYRRGDLSGFFPG
jgi:hypothetical protein